MSGPLGALQFLTRVPVRLRREPSLSASVPWFPMVGALVGAAVGGVAAGLVHWLPALVAAAVAIAIGLLITGAFHEDGLADIADAFGGGWTVERRNEILKDSRHGSYGVATMCSSIVLRMICLGSLPGPAAMFASAVAAHALGRGSAVAVMGLVPTAGPSGLADEARRSLRPIATTIAVLSALGFAVLATGWWAAPLAAAAVVAAAAVTALARRKVGGINGDVLGAVEQVAECLVFVVATGLAARHSLWWA